MTRHLAAGLPASETMRRVVHALLDHQAGDLDDDATVMIVEWHGPAGQHDAQHDKVDRAAGVDR